MATVAPCVVIGALARSMVVPLTASAGSRKLSWPPLADRAGP